MDAEELKRAQRKAALLKVRIPWEKHRKRTSQGSQGSMVKGVHCQSLRANLVTAERLTHGKFSM